MSIKEYLLETYNFSPTIGLVLGSGLGDFVYQIDKVYELNYCDIEGFPHSTVSGHEGKFVFGYLGDTPVVIMQGRVHYYEGYSIQQVTKPIRYMIDCGIHSLIVTNAAGGIDNSFSVGDLMIIEDHIMMVPNPLIGANDGHYGVRFPDMSEVYDKSYIDIACCVAQQNNIKLRRGVYVQLSGPSYETPAEITMWSRLGASAVGMSTACETVVARHSNIKVLGISCITNMASGLGGKLSHEDVKVTADMAKDKLARLIKGVVELL